MDRYFVEALSAITFLAILDVLISKTNNGRIVKMVISLISVTILGVPIVSIIKNFSFTSTESIAQVDYAEYLLNLEKEAYKNQIEKVLFSSEFEFESIDLEFEKADTYFYLNKIIIKPKNLVINGSIEHINMLETVNLILNSIINLSEVEVIIETSS